MARFAVGNRVRIDIPDETDPDFEAFHGEEGTIIEIISDDADAMTGTERDGHIYRVEFGETTADFRQHDLRPPIEE